MRKFLIKVAQIAAGIVLAIVSLGFFAGLLLVFAGL